MMCFFIWFPENVLKTSVLESANEISKSLFPAFNVNSVQFLFKVNPVNDYFRVFQDLNIMDIQKASFP